MTGLRSRPERHSSKFKPPQSRIPFHLHPWAVSVARVASTPPIPELYCSCRFLSKEKPGVSSHPFLIRIPPGTLYPECQPWPLSMSPPLITACITLVVVCRFHPSHYVCPIQCHRPSVVCVAASPGSAEGSHHVSETPAPGPGPATLT